MNMTLSSALLACAMAAGPWGLAQAAAPAPSSLPTVAAAPLGAGYARSHDGVVEAVRQSVLAAQVPGAVVSLNVKAGEQVKAGQTLLTLDARAAQQQAGAAAAQVQAARALQEAATREFERQQQLFQQHYISRAALDQAEAQYKSARAQASAQLAAADAARTQSGFYVLKVPYAGVVAGVDVVLGDMAMPGRPLLTVYDPSALRVSAAVPQSDASRLAASQGVTVELPGVDGPRVVPLRWELLPAVDPATHTQTLRLDLPPGTPATPGMFARVWLPADGQGGARVAVPAQTVVRRAEMTGVYIASGDGRVLLRQVRLGPVSGDRVEVLSGLAVGERVVLDPQAAARLR